MEKIAAPLVQKISHLQKRLVQILESSESSQPIATIAKDFSPQTDLQLVRGLSQGLPDDHLDRAVVVFSRLGLFFDAGILIENNDGEWTAQACFHHGHVQAFSKDQRKIMQVPRVDLMTVLRTPALPLLKKFSLTQIDPENKLQALMIKASHDYAYILFSHLPDIWLTDHITEVREALRSFAD